MATHGTLTEFRSNESWTTYVQRLEQYFAANDIESKVETASKQRAILLASVGTTTFDLIRSLVSPKAVTEVDYDTIVKVVKEHYNPAPLEIMERFKFHSWSHKSGETIATFAAELRLLTEHCNFKASLDDHLRDRFVCGVSDARIQRQLLSEKKLEFATAIQIAQAIEMAERDTQNIQQQPPRSVLTLHKGPSGRTEPNVAKVCYRCNGKHSASECYFKDMNCHNCGKKGHVSRACCGKKKQAQPRNAKGRHQRHTAHNISTADQPTTELPEPAYDGEMFRVAENGDKPLVVDVRINGTEIRMEIDTGASVSVVSEATYNRTWTNTDRPKLIPSTVRLSTYTEQSIEVAREVTASVEYGGQQKMLRLVVVKGNGPSLFGRDWLQELSLDWREIQLIRTPSNRLQEILDRHAEVFKPGLGKLKGVTAKIHIEPDARPRYYRPRNVPYALRERVNTAIEKLETDGVIETADWATPIVPIVKSDGSIQLCGDYKVTINQVAKRDMFPLPRIGDIFASLEGGKTFSKLDLAHAYLQVPLDEDSKKLVTINTPKGLYRYNRLPFGISAAPSIFQRTMEGLLHGIPHTSVYLDDILVTGRTDEEHLQNVDSVLNHLEEAGMRVKRNKCKFMLPEIEYLGHKICSRGLKPTEGKVRAIAKEPAPTDVSQLKSFLGMVNYYAKFLPNLATTLAPLYALLQKDTKWRWDSEHSKAFETAKTQLASSPVLVHYSTERELLLACDASPYGVGAVLSHRMDDGSDQPIAFTSRSLAPAEKNYAQLDKEALAIIFGVTKFRQYLLGRCFVILSDHKPLKYLFGEARTVPPMASTHIQRWAFNAWGLRLYYPVQTRSGSC